MFPVYIFLKDVCAVMAGVLVFTASALVDMYGLSVPFCPCLYVIRAMQRFVFCGGGGRSGGGGVVLSQGPRKDRCVCRKTVWRDWVVCREETSEKKSFTFRNVKVARSMLKSLSQTFKCFKLDFSLFFFFKNWFGGYSNIIGLGAARHSFKTKMRKYIYYNIFIMLKVNLAPS